LVPDCNGNVAQILGFFFVYFFSHKSLDKLAGWWYNENSGAQDRAPAGANKKEPFGSYFHQST